MNSCIVHTKNSQIFKVYKINQLHLLDFVINFCKHSQLHTNNILYDINILYNDNLSDGIYIISNNNICLVVDKYTHTLFSGDNVIDVKIIDEFQEYLMESLNITTALSEVWMMIYNHMTYIGTVKTLTDVEHQLKKFFKSSGELRLLLKDDDHLVYKINDSIFDIYKIYIQSNKDINSIITRMGFKY